MDNYEKIVLSICDIHPLRFGSFEEYLIEITKELNSRGFKHVVVFRKEPISSVREVFLSYNIDIRVFTPSKHMTFNFLPISRLIHDINPAIVHFHFYPPFSLLNYINLYPKRRFLYTDHMGVTSLRDKTHKLLRKAYHFLNYTFFSFPVETVVCVSNFVKSKYNSEYGIKSDKLIVIYNGINCNRFSEDIDASLINDKYNLKNELIVSCVAGLRKSKGVQCLIKAAPSIIKIIPHVKFFIIGDGEYRESLENLVHKLNIEDYFIFTGFTDHTEMFYSISSCVVVPSLVDEAFCFVAAEAIVAGCPVVAFDSGAINEAFGKIESVKVIPKSSSILANSVVDTLLNAPENSIIEGGMNLIEKEYSIKNKVKEYVELYCS
jgi:glycosyltransferase involved in cell wall biosynthesis